ncbi:MAG: hypothetical protein ACYC5M_06835 [Anaerolineae bacterium]
MMLPLLPLLPLAIPFLGIWIVWAIPFGAKLPMVRRWVSAIVLAVTAAALVAFSSPDMVVFTFWQPLAGEGESIAFATDGLGLRMALLLLGALLVDSTSRLSRPMHRDEAVNLLILVLAGIGTFMAGNLLTMCLMWGLMDVALLSLDIHGAPDEHIPHAVRNALGNLLSTIALVVATVLLSANGGSSAFADLVLTGMPVTFLVVAAILRISLYPMPGSLGRYWEAYLASFCAGGYLLIRVALGSEGPLPGLGWIAPLGGSVLLISGLLAGLSAERASTWPFVLMSGAAAVTIAPILDSVAGPGVALVTLAHIVLSVALLRVDFQLRTVPGTGIWKQIPLLVALAALVGAPLTVGLIARWSFLRLCWTAGQRSLILLAVISYMLVGVPLWQRLQHSLRYRAPAGRAGPTWTSWMAWGSAALLVGVLVVWGIVPGLFARVGIGQEGVLVLPTLRSLLTGHPAASIALALGAITLPPLGSYALYRQLAAAPGQVVRRLDTLATLLELSWLYALVERALARILYWIEQLSTMAQESFFLGWTLLGGLIVVLYLMGR